MAILSVGSPSAQLDGRQDQVGDSRDEVDFVLRKVVCQGRLQVDDSVEGGLGSDQINYLK